MNSKPNLLFIYTNGLRYDGVGFNGNGGAYTPCLDALASRSAVFENAVSGQPLATPYAASLYTGKYSVETGAVINDLRLFPHDEAFADMLGDNGYDTMFFGRWNLYSAQLGHYYNVKNSYVPEGEYRLGFNSTFASFNSSGEFFAPKSYYHDNSSAKLYSKGFEPDFQTGLAVEKLSEYSDGGKPFAMFLSFGAPSGELYAENIPVEYYDMFRAEAFPNPENYSEKNDPHADIWSRFSRKERKLLVSRRRCYAAMTAALDANIGKLVGGLKDNGLFDNTVIVFTSSCGEMLGSHGRRSANIFYDEAVRVPLTVCFGDKIAPSRITVPINTPDIMPTILSVLGIEIPSRVSGSDLSDALFGKDVEQSGCLLTGTGPAAVWGDGREWRGYRTDSFTYAVYRSSDEEFLFDNKNDPLQMNNLADKEEFAQTKALLREKMLEKMDKIGDSFEKNSFYKKNYVSKRKIKKDFPKSSSNN